MYFELPLNAYPSPKENKQAKIIDIWQKLHCITAVIAMYVEYLVIKKIFIEVWPSRACEQKCFSELQQVILWLILWLLLWQLSMCSSLLLWLPSALVPLCADPMFKRKNKEGAAASEPQYGASSSPSTSGKVKLWNKLSISLIGRTNLVKIIFRPQLLYFLHNKPVISVKEFNL